MELTFKLDSQLNDQEDWIAAGTKVNVYETVLKRSGSTPVIITNAFTYEGNPIELNQVEWFMNVSFKELS